MLTVYYTDGSEENYQTPEEAEAGIAETVMGCDFAVGVESINSVDAEYQCEWSVKVTKTPSDKPTS